MTRLQTRICVGCRRPTKRWRCVLDQIWCEDCLDERKQALRRGDA